MLTGMVFFVFVISSYIKCTLSVSLLFTDTVLEPKHFHASPKYHYCFSDVYRTYRMCATCSSLLSSITFLFDHVFILEWPRFTVLLMGPAHSSSVSRLFDGHIWNASSLCPLISSRVLSLYCPLNLLTRKLNHPPPSPHHTSKCVSLNF